VLGRAHAGAQPFIPVIGVSIGTAVTPGIVEEAARWWPSLAALLLYIPVAHAIGYGLTGGSAARPRDELLRHDARRLRSRRSPWATARGRTRPI
jgi:hypothetical protein